MMQFLFQLSDDLLLTRDDCLQVANVHDTSHTEDLSTDFLTYMCVELTARVSTDYYRTCRDLVHVTAGKLKRRRGEYLTLSPFSHNNGELIGR